MAAIVAAVTAAAAPLAYRLARGELPGDPKRIVGTNTVGDKQKALDVASHDYFVTRLTEAGARSILSEEAEGVIAGDPDGLVAVAIDPIDGSGSIGIGALLGTLFAVFPAVDGSEADFLRPARDVLAGGYLSFGHSVDLAFSVGSGVVIATLDPADGVFRIVVEQARLKPDASVIAYNASNQRFWEPGVQAYVADCLAGKSGPRGRDFNMRWLAAAVGDLHRILRQGGLFFYAADRRPGNEAGRRKAALRGDPDRVPLRAGWRGGDGRRQANSRPHPDSGAPAGAAHLWVGRRGRDVWTLCRHGRSTQGDIRWRGSR